MCSQAKPTVAPKENQIEENMKNRTREVPSKEIFSRANRMQFLTWVCLIIQRDKETENKIKIINYF